MSSSGAQTSLSMNRMVNRPINLFLFFRVIVATLIVGAGIIIIQITNEAFPVRPLYILLAVSYITGGLVYFASRIGANPLLALWTLMIADLLLETAIIFYSGGTAGQFSMIFCLTIVAAAILHQVAGGLGTALVASSLYVVYGFLENSNVLSHPVERFGFESAGPTVLESYMHVSIFLLVGGVGGYLAGKIKMKGRQLENAETRLNQLRFDTQNILDNMSSGLIVIDSEGKIVSVNPIAEEILDIRKDDALSKYLSEVFSTSMPQLAFELSHSLRMDREKSRHEITIRNSKNKNVPLGISISLLKDGEGNKRGVIAVFQDLTEVRQMQEHVRKADRLAAIGELSAGIAHELRNPLASISGSIEMLYNELELTGENKRLMELVMRESDRLDRIISDFLEYAKMRPPAMKDFTVVNTVEEVLLLIQNNLILSRQINIEMVNRIGALRVKGDEEQMRQVFLNLAVNACEAMDGVGDLTITLERYKVDWVKVDFIDEGPGVGNDDRERLFEPFFTTKEGGTGLGLAIANKIVEAHGGTISFANRESSGATFSVLLPVEKCGVIEEKIEEFEMAESIT